MERVKFEHSSQHIVKNEITEKEIMESNTNLYFLNFSVIPAIPVSNTTPAMHAT